MTDRQYRLRQCLEGMAAEAKSTLGTTVCARDFAGVVPANVMSSYAAARNRGVTELILDLVPLARLLAKPEVSGFAVGAVALGANGAAYFGANLEFAGAMLDDTVHAETAATTNAWLHDEPRLLAMALTHPPCGGCRQFLLETARSGAIEIRVDGHRPTRLRKLLPLSFGPEQLGVNDSLLSRQRHGLATDSDSSEPLVASALEAANASYAPYTRSYAGIALGVAGRVFTGRYAENAAFNPSLSPAAAALTMMALADEDTTAIDGLVLVSAPSVVDHMRDARRLLSAVCQRPLEVRTAH